ncbi:MAG: hypothetical protein LBD23_03310 [Oscillospiraceae bacterium]|jgi:hypothetical protein|nr:hypothetical protein [Oscillospiraceae bacterium]
MQYDEISAYQKELMLDEGYAHFVEIGKTMLLDELLVSDDAYYMWFTFNVEGINIIDTSTTPQLEMAYFDVFAPSICAQILITSEGIKSFYLYGNYKENGVVETKEILPFDNILNSITRKYELQIVSVPMVFVGAELEYLFLPNVNNLLSDIIMTPYWRMEYKIEDSRGTNIIFADRINAFTGEDFAYGG